MPIKELLGCFHLFRAMLLQKAPLSSVNLLWSLFEKIQFQKMVKEPYAKIFLPDTIIKRLGKDSSMELAFHENKNLQR